MLDKVRVGFIGVGGIANGHVARTLDIPEAEVVAFCDPSDARIASIKEKFPQLQSVPAFSDYKDMLKSVNMDAVQIASPHTLHFEQGMDSLDAGLHVLMEKPMVCKVTHAQQLIAKSEQKERTVLISYQRHYQPQYRYIRKMVESGAIGDVHYISALQCQGWKHGVAGTWRQIPELSGGGQLNDSGSHLMDILMWTSGLTVDSVSAYIDNRGTPVDINSALSMRFKNGAQGTVSVVGDSVCGWHEDFTIWGTKGVLFNRNGKIMYCNEKGEMSEPTDLPEGSNPDRNFIDVILGKDINWVPPTCGLRVIEVTEAAWRSAEVGGPVNVAELMV